MSYVSSSGQRTMDSAKTKGVAGDYDASGFYVDIPLNISTWVHTLREMQVRCRVLGLPVANEP